ncbi:MAG: hypothetical protein ABIH21_00185 [Patescibacteria group bacterium]
MFGKKKEENEKKANVANSENQQVITDKIFVMPVDYRHGASPSVHEPKKEVKPEYKKVVQPPPPKPIPPKPIEQKLKPQLKQFDHPKRKKKNLTLIIVVVGAVLIIAVGITGYFLIKNSKDNQSQVPDRQIYRPPVRPVEEPQPEPTEPVDTEEPTKPVDTEPAEPFPKSSTPGKDTDSDGLTDVEEALIYGTNIRLPDSDRDGFLDGNEVFHGYDPQAPTPAILMDSDIVRAYEFVNFSLNYPKAWSIKSVESVGIAIVATTGESLVVSTFGKNILQDLSSWSLEMQLDENLIAGLSKQGLELLKTQEGLTTYINAGDKVIVVSYQSGVKGTIDYLQTYQMIINSILIAEETVE